MSCNFPDNMQSRIAPDYPDQIREWRAQRLEYVKGPEGWVNLAGLFWLEEGPNTVGSDSSNDLILPLGLPPYIGTLYLENDSVIFNADPHSDATIGGNPVVRSGMIPDTKGKPTTVRIGSYQWHIIERGDQYGIRLRDLDHPAIQKLDSIPSYSPDSDWRIMATFNPFQEPNELTIKNVLDQVEHYPVYGQLMFEINGRTFTLYPLGKPPDLWIIFADGTSALETYGGGRFLELEKANTEGMYVIDFNKAYNPPCAFTPYATCPLPPKENILDINIKAGEKSPGFVFH